MPHVFTQITFMRKKIKITDICNITVHSVRHFHTKENTTISLGGINCSRVLGVKYRMMGQH